MHLLFYIMTVAKSTVMSSGFPPVTLNIHVKNFYQTFSKEFSKK